MPFSWDPFADSKDFILVDTGMENSFKFILEAVNKHYGRVSNQVCSTYPWPFDHVGL